MHFGTCNNTGIVHGDKGAADIHSSPQPSVTQANVAVVDGNCDDSPADLAAAPSRWIPREGSFDRATRTRRSPLYAPHPLRLRPQPYDGPMMRPAGAACRIAKTLFTSTACESPPTMANHGRGMPPPLNIQGRHHS